METNKTLPTSQVVREFLSKITNEQQRNDCYQIAELMQKITGEEPVIWGEHIIGFDSYHYRYASGREGDSFLIGLSPRKDKLSLYLGSGLVENEHLLHRLGKYKNGASCLNISKLADVDEAVLEELIRQSVSVMRQQYPERMRA